MKFSTSRRVVNSAKSKATRKYQGYRLKICIFFVTFTTTTTFLLLCPNRFLDDSDSGILGFRDVLIQGQEEQAEYVCTTDALDPGRTVFYEVDHFGRLGNQVAGMIHAVAHARRAGCHIVFPKALIGIDKDFELGCRRFRLTTRRRWPLPRCRNKSGKDWFLEGFFDDHGRYRLNRHLSHEDIRLARSLLRVFTHTNSTHAYAQRCETRPEIVLHVRSGDIASGKFDDRGSFIPDVQATESVMRRPPYPTSFYLKAVNFILSYAYNPENSKPRIRIISEDAWNPVTEFFSLLADHDPRYTVSISRPLLEDLIDAACAQHLVTSRSTLSHALSLHEHVRTYHFIDDLRSPSNCDSGEFYFRVKEDEEYLRLLNSWQNTDYDRALISKPIDVYFVDCA